jgi:serine/threonine-protein kinase
MATRYVALGPLLSGEGSRAFLGLRIADGEATPCALVWVPEQVMQEPELSEQLRRDTSRAAALVHPNVMRVFGLIEVDEGLARVTEFADGESLRRILDVAKRLPGGFAARVLVDAALGVQYAHVAANEDGTPLVHGDLRPETLLVSYHGVTKVTGYGALNVAPREMGGQRVMGRRLHCAPEQILGGRAAVTEQTDVYLLGLILYEVLTGSVPFADEKNFDKAVLNKNPPLLNSEFVPPSLRPVIGKAMAKKGLNRYQTVQAFREAIEEAIGELPDHAELGAFLSKAFESDDARAARKRELDAGIQEWVVKKGLKLVLPPPPPPPPPRPPKPAPVEAAAPPPAPVPEPASPADPTTPAAAPAPVAQVAQPPAPQPAPAREEEPPPPPPAKRGAPTWAIAIPAMVVAVAVAYWLGHRTAAPEKIDYSKLAAAVAAGADAASPPLAIAPPTPDLPKVEPTPPAKIEPPKIEPAAREPEVQLVLPAEKPKLEVVVEPPVTVSVDGKLVGRTPLKVDISPGPHRLALAEPGLGIQLVRAITIKPGPNRIALTIGKGAVTLDAPAGCEVKVDGRAVGRTPLPGPVEVYEGSHKIQVSVNGAHWQQAFSLNAGEKMNFEVETHTGE